MLLPCGKCLECRQQYSRDWQFRLKQEVARCPSYWWITLTYNNAHLPTVNIDRMERSTVIKSEVQNFLKRLRQRLGFPELRYFAVGEYGKKNRAHYHLLIFTNVWTNVHQAYIDVFWSWAPNGDSQGFVYVRRGELSKIRYVTKYVNKLDLRYHFAPPFKLMSKSLGLSFLSPSMTNYYLHLKQRYVYDNGYKLPLPRYYVKKLDEIFDNMYHAGLKWSEVCEIPPLPSSDNPKWFHQYFIDNFDEIREDFIEHELSLPCITKFLNPSDNMVFDWFLESCEVTRNDIWQSEEILRNVAMKNEFDNHYKPIGEDEFLPDGIM